MKKLLILILTNLFISSITAADTAPLAEISSTLTNLTVKADELGILKAPGIEVAPLISGIKPEQEQALELIKQHREEKIIPELPLINIGHYYRILRTAIRNSLINTKKKGLDLVLFGRLNQDEPGTRAAKYIIERMYELRSPNHYTIGTDITTKIRTFSLQDPQYKIENVPLDEIVDQILFISRLIDYIMTNYKIHEDVSILSIDSFINIFNIYFALTLDYIRTTSLSEALPGKINLKVLSNSPKQELDKIKDTFEKLEYSFDYYSKIEDLMRRESNIDIFLLNEKFNYPNDPTNLTLLKDGDKVVRFSHEEGEEINAIAITSVNVPKDERDALFNKYISGIFKIPKTFDNELIKNYKAEQKRLSYLYVPLIIDSLRSEKKRNSATIYDQI